MDTESGWRDLNPRPLVPQTNDANSYGLTRTEKTRKSLTKYEYELSQTQTDDAELVYDSCTLESWHPNKSTGKRVKAGSFGSNQRNDIGLES